MRIILLPLSWLYGLVVGARNAAFDIGVFRSSRVDVPVISVGNLTAGGTGKTPLVEYLTGDLLNRGKKVAVLSRGYGRSSRGIVLVSRDGTVLVDARVGGDEPVQIARKFPRASVVVGEKRAEAAKVAVERCGANVIVLDDGFQHRSLFRSLDIVVLDARKDIGRVQLLPAGMRRESVSGLRRAHLVGFSRSEPSRDPARTQNLSGWFLGGTFAYRTVIAGFVSTPDRKKVPAVEFSGKKLFAFSGIGDHGLFVADLREKGYEVAGDLKFNDHHVYTMQDAGKLVAAAQGAGAQMYVTTEKDMVRLEAGSSVMSLLCTHLPLVCATIAVDILRGREVLDEAVTSCLIWRPS